MADPNPQDPNPTNPNPASDPPPTSGGYTVTGDAWKEAGLSDSFITKDGLDLKALGASLTEAQTMKAQAEERAKALPADGKYDFGLPKDWKAPEGLDVPKEVLESWKVSPGRQAVFAEIAKETLAPQAKVSEWIGKIAAADIQEKLAAGKAEADAQAADDAKFVNDIGGKESLATLETALTSNPLLAPIFNPRSSRTDLYKAAKALLDHLKGPHQSSTNGAGANGANPPPQKTHAQVLYGSA